LAAALHEERYRSGQVIVTEGEERGGLFVVARGRAEISAGGPAGAAALGTLAPGDLFADTTLTDAEERRLATVTALTPLTLLALDRHTAQTLSASYPALSAVFAQAHDTFLIATFLKQASPFAALDSAQIARLAARLGRLDVPEGAAIVRQGEAGDACYLLRTGRAEVVASVDDAPERRLATLYPGKLFGESALLTGAPRNATVRALEPCELLVLHRDDLLAVMGEDRHVAEEMFALVHLHDRPRQAAGITAHPRATPEGETFTILSNPRTGSYYRLSPQGWFIWQRLDGKHTLRDLALEYHRTFNAFAPDAIAQVINGLAAAGFLEKRQVASDAAAHASPAFWERLTQRARGVMEWRVTLRNVDATITWIYCHGGFLLYTRVAQALFPLLVVAGLAAFALSYPRAHSVLTAQGGGLLWLFLIPAFLVATVCHEMGHALTTKHFGRQVLSAGFGWYWFGPITYMNTTDMWLEKRWPRIAVSIAGPYSDLLLGAMASLGALLIPNPVVATVLWQCALMPYLNVLFNLNILMEFDGYYVLMDLLDRPNLRSASLRWLGNGLPRALRLMALGTMVREHWIELLYGLGAVAYILVVAGVTVIAYRLTIQAWIGHLLPGLVAQGLAWVLAFVMAGLSVLGVAGELRAH
jgi:putative peptide zinc metalloprotease protein